MLLYLSLMSLSSLPIWRDEKLLFMRERDAGMYGAPSYFVAVVLFDLLPLRVRGELNRGKWREEKQADT